MISNEGDQSRGKPAADAYLDITPTFNDDLELSTVDKKWGCLFYGNTPTDRFGQLNRGIANHINELDTPKKTIVIPPRKMVEFYSRFELQDENYPLKTIFQNLSPKQISWLYEDLHCEYHLVGDGDVGKRPKIPALTPLGFDTWMTLLMLAYPNKEAERLQKIVEAMPIDADGVLVERKPERLPKQLSRHLLPPEAHRESKKTLDCVLSEFKDLATSNQTPSRNSKTSRLPPQHHNDLYSGELPTPQPRQERFAKTTLYSESSYHGQTNKTGNGRQTNNVQRGRTKPYVHNSRPNNDL